LGQEPAIHPKSKKNIRKLGEHFLPSFSVRGGIVGGPKFTFSQVFI